MNFEDTRKVISGLNLDVRILARELYGASDALGGDCAVQTIDRMLGELTRLRGQLAGGGEDQAADDTRRLDAIRALLAGFDWEHDDRQYALEAIERIVDEGGNR